MKTYCVEIRDRATCIPALVILTQAHNSVEHRYLWRCGYPESGVILMKLANQEATSDPYDWADRTMQTTHNWLYEHASKLYDGFVVDVRVILGEADEPAEAEIV